MTTTLSNQMYFNKLTLQRLQLIEIVAKADFAKNRDRIYLERQLTINTIAKEYGYDTANTRNGLRTLCLRLLDLLDRKMAYTFDLLSQEQENVVETP